jgi:hypothetical protein
MNIPKNIILISEDKELSSFDKYIIILKKLTCIENE